jgi:hypothetical protein
MSNEIYSFFPKKVGHLVKDKENQSELFLVNDEGQEYATNEALIETWKLCLGEKSVDQICKDLEKYATGDPSDLKKDIVYLIQKLESANLLILESKSLAATQYS